TAATWRSRHLCRHWRLNTGEPMVPLWDPSLGFREAAARGALRRDAVTPPRAHGPATKRDGPSRVAALPARAVPASLKGSLCDHHGARSAPDHKGMLPCLRRGPGSWLVSDVSRASINTGRVRRGSITSST